jgi:hypothetical protein
MKGDMGLLQVLGLPSSPGVAGNASAGHSVAGGGAAGRAKTEKLSKAAEAWRQTHRQANARIATLKAAIKSHYADGHPELIQAVEQGLIKLDDVLGNVDHRLADSLAHASNAPDDRSRDAELKNAKAILTEYIGYMRGEPLIAHMDQNPWKVKIDLKALLVGGLTSAAKAIG